MLLVPIGMMQLLCALVARAWWRGALTDNISGHVWWTLLASNLVISWVIYYDSMIRRVEVEEA
jgi:hypothetical protein